MPYIASELRNLVDPLLEDMLDFIKWNVYLMHTRDETLYHIIVSLLRRFYGTPDCTKESIQPIDPDRRTLVDKKLRPLIDYIAHSSFLIEKKDGVLNYIICRTINGLYPREISRYADYNNAIGVLENAFDDARIDQARRHSARGLIRCVSMEYYRRRVSPYEDDARDTQGDIFE